MKTVFPQGDKKGILNVTGFTHHIYNDSSPDIDPTDISFYIYGDPTTNFKWVGLPQPSIAEDYYNDWKISIYINNNEVIK